MPARGDIKGGTKAELAKSRTRKEKKMKIKLNDGEWVGEWAEFCAVNSDAFSSDEFETLRRKLEVSGCEAVNMGAGGVFTLEITP